MYDDKLLILWVQVNSPVNQQNKGEFSTQKKLNTNTLILRSVFIICSDEIYNL